MPNTNNTLSPEVLGSVPEHLKAIKAQACADVAFELIAAGQQHPDFLLSTLNTIDSDCLRDFLRQLSKRIGGSR